MHLLRGRSCLGRAGASWAAADFARHRSAGTIVGLLNLAVAPPDRKGDLMHQLQSLAGTSAAAASGAGSSTRRDGFGIAGADERPNGQDQNR